MQVCISLPTDNHASTPPLILLQAGCPSCRPTNSVKNTEAKMKNGKVIKKLKPKTEELVPVKCQWSQFW